MAIWATGPRRTSSVCLRWFNNLIQLVLPPETVAKPPLAVPLFPPPTAACAPLAPLDSPPATVAAAGFNAVRWRPFGNGHRVPAAGGGGGTRAQAFEGGDSFGPDDA